MSQNQPEGPYDLLSSRPQADISNTELARLIRFVEQFESESEAALSMKSGYRELRMMVHLMRNHLEGRLTTPTSLAAASGLSYGTAMRGIDSIIERGLIVRRPRTRTGKTFSLHPSDTLINDWQDFAQRIKTMIGTAFGFPDSDVGAGFFFGASLQSAKIIPPPTVLSRQLELSGQLRMLLHADPTFMSMHNLKKQIENIFGTPIRNKALSIDRLHDEIRANAALAESKYDIIACDLPWFGELASQDILLPLDDLYAEGKHDLSDFHPEALTSASYEGKQYGIPVQPSPELLCYREDIFREAGLNPPHTIEQTVEAAKRLNSPSRGVHGIAWNGARGTPLGHSFLMMMSAFGQPILNLERRHLGYSYSKLKADNWRPMFQSEAAEMTLEYMKALLPYSPRGTLDMSWYDRAQVYASGRVAMAYCYSILAPLFELDKSSPAFGHTGYLPHPHGPGGSPIAPLGGYALAIPANVAPERRSAIWTAMKTLTSAGLSKLYITNGSVVSARFSVSRDPQVAQVSPVISIVDKLARQDQLQAWPRPPVPEINQLVQIAGEEVHDALSGKSTVAEALKKAQNRADQLMRDNGRYK
ncbi:MAG: extracellular solute-binding protein [Natronospirillum sp.]|uniref:extracellular solute-binding protein n=1 Tax=Natronospirillum sp. TaxID=2812955 RepID=UPI0025E885A4|nr:extracellular solute-binding protein [Natronospirillum sp.]MCH8550866.1 extracellular solute-binding protein [Natronospirillum sp.]